MKIPKAKIQLFFFFMTGFLTGILYANLLSKQYVTASGIFNQYFLEQYVQTEIIRTDYFFYILRSRMIPFALLAMFGLTRFRRIFAGASLAWTGFSGGVLAVAAVFRMGLSGIMMCIVGIFPHFICYGLGYAVAVWYLFTAPESKWNHWKTVFVLLMFAMGVILEAYVNPSLMKWLLTKMV